MKVFRQLFCLIVLPALAGGQVNVTTYHNDNARTGQNTHETVLTLANVNKTSFGKKFSQKVDGYVYAQPLYQSKVAIPGKGTHNVVYVVTEHDSIFAFDADSNAGANASPLWKTSLIDPAHGISSVPSGDTACNDLVPEIGITSTPAISAAMGTMYVLAKTKENGQYVQRLHALDVTTGQERSRSPVVIQATVSGTGDGSVNGKISFDPLRAGQRAGLLLQNGLVYITWASHCDIGPYHGWVMAYDVTTLKQVGVQNTTPNGGLGGIWQSGAGPAGDATFVYLATGNGTFDLDSGGVDSSDSILKLGRPSGGVVPLKDYFTPFNQAALNNGDTDLGSGGVLLLPNQTGPHKHLLVQAGKEGSIYLINRDNLGHYNPNNNNQTVQFLPTVVGGLWSMPAWWNNNLYIGGAGDGIHQFVFHPSTGLLATASASQTVTLFSFPSATPSISSNGTTQGIIWALNTDAAQAKGPAVLHAYDAMNLANELYNTEQRPGRDRPGAAIKFTVPTIANGKVYVGAEQQISVYGLLP